MEIKNMLEEFGMTQTELSRRFKIPLRTIQHWVAGTRKCPDYTIMMIREILKAERKS